MSITIFDKTLTQLAIVDDYSSLLFGRGWYSPQSFQIVINKNTLYSDQFQIGFFIMVDDDPYKSGIIESIKEEIDQTGANGNNLTIKGRELLSIFDRRVVYPPSGQDYYTATSNVENILKTLITDQTTTVRAFSLLDITTNQNRGPTYTFSARYKNLLEAISDTCLSTGVGAFCYLDKTAKKIKFDIGISLDRTIDNGVNNPAVLSTDLETLKSAKVIDDERGRKNLAVVAGQGEGKDRTVVATYIESSEPTDMDRKEWFIDARDVSTVGGLQTRGAQKLAEVDYSKYLEAAALEYSKLIYRQDYDLGDDITIKQFDAELDVKITGIIEYWEQMNYKIDLIFDKALPLLNDQVAKTSTRTQEIANTIEIPQPLKTTSSPTFAGATIGGVVLPTRLTEMDNETTSRDIDSGIVGHWPFDDVPEYPDEPTGISYLQDAWLTTDSWTAGANCTLSVSSANLVVTATGSDPDFYHTGTNNGKLLILKAKKNTNLTDLQYYNGTTYTSLTKVFDSNNLQIWEGRLSSTHTDTQLKLVGLVSTDIFTIDWIYIGDGTFINTTKDVSPSRSNATLTPDIIAMPGVTGKSLRLIAPSATISTGLILPGTTVSDSWAISAWIRFDADPSGTECAIVGAGTFGGSRGIWSKSTVALYAQFRTNESDTASVAMLSTAVIGKWYHVVLTMEGSTRRTYRYLDGILLGSAVIAAGQTWEVANILINALSSSGGSPTLGRKNISIDDVRIYNENLTIEKVRNLYKNPSGKPPNIYDSQRIRNGKGSNLTTDLVVSETPASASAYGIVGQIRYDANYIYICTAANTWKRAGIATW